MKSGHVAPSTALLPVEKVWPDPGNPRTSLGDLTDLAESIRQIGVLQPVTVRVHPDRTGEWILVTGHRRLAAAIVAGDTTIPAVLRPDLVLEEDARATQLVENLHRADLDPVDEAAGYGELLRLGWTQSDIAERVARSKGHVSKRLRLLALPADVASHVRSGSVRVEDGYQLAKALDTAGIDQTGLLTDITDILESDDPDPHEVETTISSRVREANLTTMRRQLTVEAETSGAVELGLDEARTAKLVSPFFLPVDGDAHRSEPCSRFRVVDGWEQGLRTVTVNWYCLSPARHYPDGDSPAKVADDWLTEQQTRAAQQQQRAEKATRDEEAKKQRDVFYRKLLTNPADVPTGQVFSQAIRLLIDSERFLAAPVLNLLGQATKADPVTVLLERFEADPTSTALAVVLAVGEKSNTHHRRSEADLVNHTGFLDACGFTEPEQLEVGL
jgi:ParB/RepB/Spo0J family partition protein